MTRTAVTDTITLGRYTARHAYRDADADADVLLLLALDLSAPEPAPREPRT